jgi:hypothetical protein
MDEGKRRHGALEGLLLEVSGIFSVLFSGKGKLV